MAESVPVNCPECSREHTWTPPVYPCDCGAPVTLPLMRGGLPARVRHRTWEESWVKVTCRTCGRARDWPQPELGCGCGALLRLPVASPAAQDAPGTGHGAGSGARTGAGAGAGAGAGVPAEDLREAETTATPEDVTHPPAGRPHSPGTTAPGPLTAHGTKEPPATRPAFRPVTIRTAQDARTAAAQYLRWLGFTRVRVPDRPPASGIDLRGHGIIAHVDPSTAPTALRDVETLWLNGLNEEACTACFSLAGYAREARTRADALGVPLFVLDLTGMPQAVNDPADDLIRSVR